MAARRIPSTTFSKKVLQVCSTSNKLGVETDDAEAAGVSRTLRRIGKKGAVHEANTQILFSIASLSKQTGVAELQREEEIGRAELGVGGMDLAPSVTKKMETALDISAGTADAVASFADTWDSLLDNIKPFIEITDKLAGVRCLMSPFRTVNTYIRCLVDASIRKYRPFYLNSCAQGTSFALR